MASYHLFTFARSTQPDPVALTTAVRAATGDATTVLANQFNGTWRGKKNDGPWAAPQIADVQTALDTTPAVTPQLSAQRTIDSFPIEYRALVLALVDAINVLRTHPAIGLSAITPAQAIGAIRAKAATL
jgi:hypothetical protein